MKNHAGQGDRVDLVKMLHEATISAISAARIDDSAGLTRALRQREQLLLQLWGMGSEEKLPEHTPELAAKLNLKLTPAEAKVMNEVKSLEKQLLDFMAHGLGRLVQQNQTLNRGERAIVGIRNAVSDPRNKGRLDIRG